MNFNNYTQKSIEAVQSAQQLAVQNSHQQMEQVHLLLAMLRQEGGLIPQLLKKMDVTVESLEAAAEAELRQWAAGQGKYLTGRYSPGYGDWPIAVQPLLAAALDTARRAGLCVTDSDLMTPRKSITAVLGVSDHPVKGHLAGCGHCVLRTRCEYRKRGITCASE